MAKNWVHKLADIPEKPFFAILELRSITIPGDERSRTNPGHGYPESTERVWDLITFGSEAEWHTEVNERLKRERNGTLASRDWKPVQISPATITITTNVTVSLALPT